MGPVFDSANLDGNFGVPFEVDAGWLKAGYGVLLPLKRITDLDVFRRKLKEFFLSKYTD